MLAHIAEIRKTPHDEVFKAAAADKMADIYTKLGVAFELGELPPRKWGEGWANFFYAVARYWSVPRDTEGAVDPLAGVRDRHGQVNGLRGAAFLLTGGAWYKGLHVPTFIRVMKSKRKVDTDA